MCYSCVLQAARSCSYENISILCVRLGHLTHRSLVSNPEDNRGQSFRRFRSSCNISKLHFDWTEKSATRRCALCPRSRPTGHNRLATSPFFLQQLPRDIFGQSQEATCD